LGKCDGKKRLGVGAKRVGRIFRKLTGKFRVAAQGGMGGKKPIEGVMSMGGDTEGAKWRSNRK